MGCYGARENRCKSHLGCSQHLFCLITLPYDGRRLLPLDNTDNAQVPGWKQVKIICRADFNICHYLVTSCSEYNEERNLLRLRAWEQRNQETSQAKEQENVPLFGEPYKVKLETKIRLHFSID